MISTNTATTVTTLKLYPPTIKRLYIINDLHQLEINIQKKIHLVYIILKEKKISSQETNSTMNQFVMMEKHMRYQPA